MLARAWQWLRERPAVLWMALGAFLALLADVAIRLSGRRPAVPATAPGASETSKAQEAAKTAESHEQAADNARKQADLLRGQIEAATRITELEQEQEPSLQEISDAQERADALNKAGW